jgi:hypothetical protein
MNKRNVIQYSLYIFFALLIAGCDNFLNSSNPSNFSEKSYYKTAEDANKAINAIYSSVYGVYGNQAWMINLVRTGIVNTQFPQDAGFPSLVKAKKLGNFSQHPDISSLWNTYYQGIANANLAIAHIPDIEMDKAERKQLLGQAHFLRAYYYFNLVRYFGKVPLIKKPLESVNSPDLQPNQASVDSVYNLIVKDLKFADSSDLPFNNTTGKVTDATVKSLLSTVYLTMAGYPLKGGTKYYKLARDEAKKVIDSGAFSLFDSYHFLKDPNDDNTGEYIYEIQFNEDDHPNNSLQEGLVPYRVGISKYSAEEGFVFVPDEFVNTFEKGDKRIKAFFYHEYPKLSNSSDTAHFQNYYIYKFFNKDAMLNTAKSGLNWPVIRYAEVLLNYAEASNEVSGPTPEAYKAVNKIRERAGIPNLTRLTKSEFRKAIWLERYHELCFENKTWFLMARTRKALDIKTGNFEDYVGHTFIYGITLKKRDLLFPLPHDELRNNPNLKQNPGF